MEGPDGWGPLGAITRLEEAGIKDKSLPPPGAGTSLRPHRAGEAVDWTSENSEEVNATLRECVTGLGPVTRYWTGAGPRGSPLSRWESGPVTLRRNWVSRDPGCETRRGTIGKYVTEKSSG
ncbi:hypothetical protein NDU88_002772 [Pleurodeles waltl]|uniref:Uncharacterized protein n=1 Tax=Pleurodeles waltl TaxID=8319 RepID=A0AAV7LL31_PLEWA|nr:hypothetical protein NDU88_002772 [Pleurodeles waltl]